MRVTGLSSNIGYTRELQLEARTTEDTKVQLRLAEKSNHVGVLKALVSNKNISDDAVQALFERDISSVTRHLQAAGYEKSGWL